MFCFSFAKSGNCVKSPSATCEDEACAAKQCRSVLFCSEEEGRPTVSGAGRLCPDAAAGPPVLSLLEPPKLLDSTYCSFREIFAAQSSPTRHTLYCKWSTEVDHQTSDHNWWNLFFLLLVSNSLKAFQTRSSKGGSLMSMFPLSLLLQPANVASLWSPRSGAPMPPTPSGTPCPPCRMRAFPPLTRAPERLYFS